MGSVTACTFKDYHNLIGTYKNKVLGISCYFFEKY